MERKTSAMTLVELMVTILIFAGLLSLGIVSLRGYFPKQRLIASAQNVQLAFERAQSEATARSRWTCVQLNTATRDIAVWVDENGNHESSGDAACGDTGDMQFGTNVPLRTNVSFASCGTTGVVWFSTSGQPNLCSGGSCAIAAIQVFVSSSDLPSGARTREIDVNQGGLIQIAKLGQRTTYGWSTNPVTSDGVGCE